MTPKIIIPAVLIVFAVFILLLGSRSCKNNKEEAVIQNGCELVTLMIVKPNVPETVRGTWEQRDDYIFITAPIVVQNNCQNFFLRKKSGEIFNLTFNTKTGEGNWSQSNGPFGVISSTQEPSGSWKIKRFMNGELREELLFIKL